MKRRSGQIPQGMQALHEVVAAVGCFMAAAMRVMMRCCDQYGCRELDADLAEGEPTGHQVGTTYMAAALHRAVEEARPFPCLARLIQLFVGPRRPARAREEEGQVLGARDVARVAAVE